MTQGVRQAVVIREIRKEGVGVFHVGERIGVVPADHGWGDLGVYTIVESRWSSMKSRLISYDDFRFLSALELLAEQGE